MREAVTISALARSTGVPSKTLRYWEQLGLLPQAARSHTGYRLFGPESVHYVEFIQKAKSIGLTLSEIGKVLELARRGRNPCPEVARWTEEKLELLERQIRFLRALQQRLRRLRRVWSRKSALSACVREGEICCLIEDLPEFRKGGANHGKTLDAVARRVGGAGA